MTTILYYQKKLLTSIFIILVKKDIINILIQKLEIVNKIGGYNKVGWTNKYI